MRKLGFSIAGLVLFFFYAGARENVYSKISDTGKILNAEEFLQSKKQILELLKVTSADVKINEILTDSICTNNSIVKTYKHDIKVDKTEPVSTKRKEGVFEFVGKKLPERTLLMLNGKELKLRDLEGKPTVLNFWFTACTPCIDEMPVLNKIKRKYQGKVNFVAITYERKEKVEAFFQEHQFDYLKVVAADAFIKEIGVRSFPKNIFIDKEGIVQKVEGGIPYVVSNKKREMGNGKMLTKIIDDLLK